VAFTTFLQIFGVTEPSVDDWCTKVALDKGKERKAMASLTLLVFSDNWNICNARIFRRNSSITAIDIAKIKDEASGGGVELSLGILFG
jgi:hypothetical protein